MTLIVLNKPPTRNYFDLVYYTKSFKIFVKFCFGQSRGSQAVTKSLLAGLNELCYDFKFNPGVVPPSSPLVASNCIPKHIPKNGIPLVRA